MALAMARGGNITGQPNIDDRQLQKELALLATAPPPMLILGSSRVMTLSSADLGVAGVRNASVGGAGVMDVIGVYDMYLKRGLEPAELIVGVDPWMFNQQSGDTRWVSIAPEAGDMLTRLGPSAPDVGVIVSARSKRTLTLLSLNYFQEAIRQLNPRHPVDSIFIVTGTDSNATATRRSDGSFVYDEQTRHATPGDANRAADLYRQAAPIYQLGWFPRIDAMDSSVFARFINFVERRGVRVTLVLPPYYPSVYYDLRTDPRYSTIVRVERMIREFAAVSRTPLCGSYDPAKVGFAATAFYDGMHARATDIATLVRACRSLQ